MGGVGYRIQPRFRGRVPRLLSRNRLHQPCLRSSALGPAVTLCPSEMAGAMTAGRERGAVHGGKVGYRLRKVHRGEAVFHGRRNREAPAKRVRRWNRKLFFLFLPVLAFESLA